jgi:hypothetical protein
MEFGNSTIIATRVNPGADYNVSIRKRLWKMET